MTIFNIKGELNPGSWFDYEEGIEDTGRACVRVANARALEDIYKQTRKKKIEYKTVQGRVQRFEYFECIDEEKENTAIYDYCIVDWEGFFDSDGNAIPCTKENKYALMQGSPEFVKFIARCQKHIRGAQLEEEEDKEKNLQDT